MKNIKNWLLYKTTIHRNKLPFLVILFTLLAFFWIMLSNGSDVDWCDINSWWILWGDPIIGILTFFVAVAIWLMNAAKYWEDRLGLKLSVIYKDSNGREVIIVEKAFLAHEGDVRNWGQTLGRQAVGKGSDGRDLYFELTSSIIMNKPEVVKGDNSYYKHYTVIFIFTKLPAISDLKNKEDMSKGKFLWKEGEETAAFVEDQNNDKYSKDEKPDDR